VTDTPRRFLPSDEQRAFWRSQAITVASRDLARIPARFASATIDHPDVDVWVTTVMGTAVSAASDWREPVIVEGPSLLLVGATGTGKTHLAYAAVRALLTSGIRCSAVVTTAADLYAAMRPRFGIDSEEEFARHAHVPVLALDDLGAAKPSEWNEEVNYRLVNYRYERKLPTFITSNVPPKELARVLGDRVASRLVEMAGAPVVLKGSDRRTTAAAEQAAR
jgi:DNA replication protein DnaC